MRYVKRTQEQDGEVRQRQDKQLERRAKGMGFELKKVEPAGQAEPQGWHQARVVEAVAQMRPRGPSVASTSAPTAPRPGCAPDRGAPRQSEE